MHGFSTVDGFVEITECLAEMIKYVANEPSVGLFYVQQHTQNAVPNLITLRKNVMDKSRETTLHTEDSEDSLTMLRSMKECGFPIADEMIRDIKKSLLVMSKKQPRKGLIHDSVSAFQIGRNWEPASWRRSEDYGQQDSESDSYFSSVFKSAKQKASNFKWSQLSSKESLHAKDEKMMSYPNPPQSVASAASTSSSRHDVEADELPLSVPFTDEPQETEIGISSPPRNLSSLSENYDDFKADKEAKLEEWLEETGNLDHHEGASDADGVKP
ncbi:uncharacterized protein LOC107404225 [Ziziphus jujuba]|uniref:Uncharacterized protein LOC107404225 n=2 Tax=Ziziphus jujuba TaxID=326968 RepID=A0A6P6FMB6_ZIZJJ|nr:uncharacterized protein LOC107404225 [Ziziphus jujuba]XP_015866663.1 uncharacterized protein LOC107404225 [Ziziphus jujuba]XP_015866664.1 uncharacterized protein LOC107404225 [Ziziphus jujuba]XP_048321804.1 uncharacterized protein LOC107404225 [Ziziphus jujuba]XP_048321805.1 uncharacterized protein LOC107404225 [Ziziphus jujuba]KAH7513236.1 hypothetical protein FEM48_Zijuj12G0175700 [Ziziphus jujuba var. spinosa]